MRTSVGWLAAAALCLGAASGARAQGINFNPFAPPSNGVNYQPFGAMTPTSASTSTTQPTFPPAGASLAGPSRLINLLPSLHSLSNTHYIGYSLFPSQTDQYLAQFGYQKLR